MTVPKSYKGVLKEFAKQPAEVQSCFKHLPKLVEEVAAGWRAAHSPR